MPPETVNLIIGAGIALFSSVLTSILSFVFQRHSEKRKRKWELEDFRRQKQIRIKIERLEQLETWSNNRISYFREVHLQLANMIGEFSNQEELREWIKQSSEKPGVNSQMGINYHIRDEQLVSISKAIDSFWKDIFELFKTESSGDAQLDQLGMIYLLGSTFQEKVKLHGKFLARIDEMKCQIYEDAT